MALSRALVYGSDRARSARDFCCWALIGAERSPVSCSVIEGRAGVSETNQTEGVERYPLLDTKSLIQSIRAFYCCIPCIVVIDAEKVDRSWSTLLCLEGKECRYWTRSPKRSSGSGARARRCTTRETHRPAQRTGSDRTCARALQQGHAGKKNRPSHSNGGRSSARTWAADYNRKTGRRQAGLIEPERSGPCPSNRQDAARNHRCMQGRSPEPCRRRDCPAQAGRPRRRARWEALRHAVDGDGATRRGLKQREDHARLAGGCGE